ncbi:MAG: hypothetical protein EBS06_08675 [Proteobacteria bacterium]|nr:hypothetical protein [Pseudomonadota bacterium]
MNSSKKKDLVEYKQTQPEQLKLFESEESYSNTIELYDSMPKYYFGGVEREKGKNVDSLPILNREFMHRKRSYKLSISPAAVQDKKTGKTIYYYPSQREEIIEDVIRKISTKPSRAILFDNDIGVKFTYYEVQQELKKIGHGYSLDQIKLGIEILNKSVLETTSREGNEISITSSLFSYVGKETKEMGGKERVVVIFNPLVTRSINQGTYRLINYDKLMKMKMQVSRWLHKRISHIFTQAAPTNPYPILLSTIVRDSGMKEYKTVSERIRQIEKALEELRTNKVISKWVANPKKEKNRILDMAYLLYMSDEFVSDAIKANQFTNKRLGSGDSEVEVYDVDELRREMEKPIYRLSKTVINNLIENISNKWEFDKVSNGLEAVRQYLQTKKVENPAAAVRKAIKEGWVPPKKEKEDDLVARAIDAKTIEHEKQSKKLAQREIQESSIWLEIRKKIKSEFNSEDWNTWLSKLEVAQIEKNKIIFSAPDKFIRDWVIKKFVEVEKGRKSLVKIIQKSFPEVEEVSVVYIQE